MQKKKQYPVNQSADADKRRGRQGQVIVIEDRCKGCGFCIANCPRQVLSFSSVFNAKGYHLPKAVDPAKCVNCHFCEILCPDFAIYSLAYSDLND